ncbi:hypothetical protein Tco_1222325, partial [Tanacetum coccineum]
MYYQVFRGDGSSKNYKVLSEMLEDFDRQDVEELYMLVKEKYSASRLEGFDLMLWGDLYTLFESDEEYGLAIHMLTEKKYPLSQEMISKTLSRKLEVDHESSQAFELLRKEKFEFAMHYPVQPQSLFRPECSEEKQRIFPASELFRTNRI